MNFKTCMHVLKEWFLYYCNHNVLYLVEFYLAWFLKFLLLKIQCILTFAHCKVLSGNNDCASNLAKN